MLWSGKRANESIDGMWLSSPIDIYATRGVAYTLPTFFVHLIFIISMLLLVIVLKQTSNLWIVKDKNLKVNKNKIIKYIINSITTKHRTRVTHIPVPHHRGQSIHSSMVFRRLPGGGFVYLSQYRFLLYTPREQMVCSVLIAELKSNVIVSTNRSALMPKWQQLYSNKS